jgi:hypothetical protein
MAQYITRAGRCLLKLIVLLAAVFAAMALTGTFDMKGYGSVTMALWNTPQGKVVVALVVVWAAVYPLVSFTKIGMRTTIAEQRENLVNAFAAYGYRLETERDDRLTFRATSTLKRLLWQFDDAVTVTQDGGFMDIEGLKKIVPRVETRLKAMMGR